MEEGLKYLAAVHPHDSAPREVLRAVLQESGSPAELHLQSHLRGNRIAACVLLPGPESEPDSESELAGGEGEEALGRGRRVLLLRTGGSIGQTLQLYQLEARGPGPTCAAMQVSSRV